MRWLWRAHVTNPRSFDHLAPCRCTDHLAPTTFHRHTLERSSRRPTPASARLCAGTHPSALPIYPPTRAAPRTARTKDKTKRAADLSAGPRHIPPPKPCLQPRHYHPMNSASFAHSLVEYRLPMAPPWSRRACAAPPVHFASRIRRCLLTTQYSQSCSASPASTSWCFRAHPE